jgi:hypothetical protein
MGGLKREALGIEVTFRSKLRRPVGNWRLVGNGDVVAPFDERHVGHLVDLPVVLDVEHIAQIGPGKQVVAFDALPSDDGWVEPLAHLAR